MKNRYEEAKASLFALSLQDRIRLLDEADLKIEEDSHELSLEWKAELNRRLEDLRSGRVQGIPAAEVFQRVRAKLGIPAKT